MDAYFIHVRRSQPAKFLKKLPLNYWQLTLEHWSWWQYNLAFYQNLVNLLTRFKVFPKSQISPFWRNVNYFIFLFYYVTSFIYLTFFKPEWVCNFQSMKVPWNWIAFYQNSFVISPGLLITWLDARLDDLQTRPLRQILLFLRDNSGLKITKRNTSVNVTPIAT